ncbi:hypothetical protein [Burkholderia gladioli]|uniref:hypothetical protein n=1 Tax=Burkholderia gladioli TaxID=28095 RepID=UPI0016415909|nr:hypothetical protein [Burkholderia gladioli]
MTAYAIVQHPDFEDDVPSTGHELKFARTFWTATEFRDTLCDAIVALHRIDEATPKLLVISTHGKELTGTHLLAGLEPIDLATYGQYFGVLPKNLIVYLSACWGGYSSPASAIQSGTCPPIVVGPLVHIGKTIADTFQAALLDLLEAGVPSASDLECLIARFNDDETLRANYYGHCLFGMWDNARLFYPAEAADWQLAAPVESVGAFCLLEPVRYGASGEVIAWVVVEEQSGEKFQANIPGIFDLAPGDPKALIGARFNAPYQVASDLDNPQDVGVAGLPFVRIIVGE